MGKLILPLILLALLAACATQTPLPKLAIGTKTYQAVVYRAGAPMGPSVCLVHVIEISPDGKTQVIDSAKATTGGGLDALTGSGSLIKSGAAMLTTPETLGVVKP
jgi:hypothetical protein